MPTPSKRRRVQSRQHRSQFRRRTLARTFQFETLESRQVLTGFLQGYAFIDANSNDQLDPGEVRKEGATIELHSADGSTLLASTITNSDGYYRFDNLDSGTYRLRETAPGYVTTGVQIQNTLSDAIGVNGNTEIQVTLTAPSDPAWQSPPALTPLTITRLPGLAGVNTAYTLTGAPFNAFTQVANPTNAHQFEMTISGAAMTPRTAHFYSFCVDLFHATPAAFAVTPSLVPPPPGLSGNIARIGYLYNEIGMNLLTPTEGTAMQLAVFELVYDVTPDLASGNFVVNQATTNAAAYALANSYLAASAGKDQRAVFLHVTPPQPTGDFGRQGMIITEKFNFANSPIRGELSITITPDDTNEVGQPHTFTVTVLQDDGLAAGAPGGDAVTGFGPASGANVAVTLDGINGAIPDVSAPSDLAAADPSLVNGVTNASGQFFVTFGSATAGQVIGNASTTQTVSGTPLTRDTDPATATVAGPNGSGPVTKTYVDARIIITPDDTNEVGQPHTFIVTVLEDSGDGIDADGDGSTFDPAAGETVTVTLANANGALANPSGPFVVVTNAIGQAAVTISSATAGTVTGHASSNVSVGGLSLHRETNGLAGNSDDAVKRYVDARIIITPEDTNEVGQPHTFIVTVLEDSGDGIDADGDGSTFDPAAGETVTVTLANANGALANPAGPFVMVTNAMGQAAVTFSSAAAGTVTGHASSDVSVGGLSLHRETNGLAGNSDDAVKRYVDARIIITPDDTNEVGQPHTFIVTVLEDSGDGIDADGDGSTFDPAAGETVTVTLANANGALANPSGPFVVVTNAIGQAAVTISSATAGTVTGHASSNVSVGGLSLHRETNGLAGNSDDAVKRYVDARITIAPDATNPVGAPHTFTITVQQDDGLTAAQGGDGVTGFAAAVGANVMVTLTNAGGAVAAPAGPTNGVTNASGQFSVTFTSATAGQVIGNATASLLVSGLNLSRDTDPATPGVVAGPNGSGPATKTFVRSRIIVEKQTIPGNIPFTFDFIRDFGPNFSLAGGQSITFDNVAPGSYSVREVFSPAFPLAQINVFDPDNGTTANPLTQSSSIDLDPGETVRLVFVNMQNPFIVIGPDKSLDNRPVVSILNSNTGEIVEQFLAFEESYTGGVRSATGDLTGDGVPEIVTAPGRNHIPLVRVFDQSGNLLTEFLAFDSSFLGGVDVAVGDVDGDGRNDIIAGQGFGGSAVRVFRNVSSAPLTFQPYQSEFYPFGAAFIGGVVVAAADMGTFVNGTVVNASIPDGQSEIIVGNEAGMRSTVVVVDYSGPTAAQVRTFLPLDNLFRGGVAIDAARINGDPIPDLIVGAGNQGGSKVEVIDGLTGSLITSFVAFSSAETTSFQAPLRVSAIDRDLDGIAESIAVVQGSDGSTRLIRFFNPLTGAMQTQITEDDPNYAGAYFVAALPMPIGGPQPQPGGVTSVSVVNGNLIIEGDAGDDVVSVTQPVPGQTQFVVTTLQGSQTVNGVFGDIQVNLHAGDDQFTMNNVLVAGKISILTELGNDVVRLGHSAIVSSADNLEVDLGAGSDVLSGQRLYIGSNQLFNGGDGDDQITFAGSFNNAVFVLGTSSGGATSISAGAGSDTINVRYSFIVGQWTFDGGLGNDNVFIDTSACSSNVTVLGGADQDVLVVDTNFFQGAIVINGNAGNDQLRLSNSLGIQLSILLGEDGTDSAVVQNLTSVRLQLDLGASADTGDVRSSSLDELFAQLGDADDMLTLFGNLVRGATNLNGGAGIGDRLLDLGNSFRGGVQKQAFELFA